MKDDISIWGSAQLTYSDLRLGFGGDTVNTIFLPYGVSKVTTVYTNSRQVFSFRAGIRFYKRAANSKIALWASPVFGYSHDNLGSKSYKDDLQREDLSFNYSYLRKSILARKSIRRLELGAEVGARWTFTRHFYVEGSVMFTVDRNVKDQRYSKEGGYSLAAGLQF